MSRSGERPRPFWLPAVAFLAALALRLLGATWRVRVLGDDPFVPPRPRLVGALWHESVFLAAHFFRDRGIVVMVSRSRDGDAIEAVLAKMGFAGSARGSSSRGGASALRQQAEQVGGDRVGAILVDGPRGPARVAKAGVVRLAQGVGARIQPVILRARPALRFGSWDRTILPAPFARVVAVYGRQLVVPATADAAQREAIRVEVERALAEAEAAAEDALRPRHHAA